MNRSLRIDPKTFRLGFLRYITLFGSSDGSESCETQPNCGTVFHNIFGKIVVAFFVLKALFRLFTWLFFNLAVRETDTRLLLCIPIQFYRIDIREDANTHKVILYKYLSNRICTVVEEFCQSDFCLWRFCFSTCFYLVSLNLAQRVVRLSVSVLVHDHHSHAGNCTGLPSNTGLFLSTGNTYLFLFQRQLSLSTLDHSSCFDFPVSGVKVSQSEFLIYTSFHHRLQIFDNWASISFDESPSRTIPIRS